MSESYDRSYYEIALTNGQVLVALGILFGCVIGAFLSGLWVAKKALDRNPPGLEQVAVREPDAETFEFFGDQNQGGIEDASSESAPTSGTRDRGPSPGAQDAPTVGQRARQSGATDQDAASRLQTAQGQEARPETVQQVRPLERAAVDQEPPASRPASGSSPTAEPGSAGAPPVTSSSLEEVRVIQVFSSNDESQANSLVVRLRDAGYRTFVAPVDVDGRTMYRVRVGPFSNQGEAARQADRIKKTFKLDTWITSG